MISAKQARQIEKLAEGLEISTFVPTAARGGEIDFASQNARLVNDAIGWLSGEGWSAVAREGFDGATILTVTAR